MSDRPLFRQRAILAYRRGTGKDVVPHLISWPIIVCLWLLLGMCITAGFFSWYIRIPTFVEGSGIIAAQGDLLQPASRDLVAVVFLSPDQSAHLRVGLPTDLQIGSAGMHVRGTIANVEPGIVSPYAARKRYQLDGAGALLITQPSIVVIVRLRATLQETTYAGTIVAARVEIGSQRLLTLVPGLGRFFGGTL